MAKSKEQKKEIIKKLEDKIGQAKSIVFAGFDALTVADNEAIRAKLRDQDSEYYVAKKTLVDKALAKHKIEGVNAKGMSNKLALAFSYKDEVASAKVLGDFKADKEKSDKLVFLGGILEGRFISVAEVENLATLPSRNELEAKVVGSLAAPLSGLVNVLAGNLRSLVYCLQAIADQKNTN